MKYFIPLFLLLLTQNISAQEYSKKETKQILDKVDSSYQSLKTVVYGISEKSFRTGNTDTNSYRAVCSLEVEPKDYVGTYLKLAYSSSYDSFSTTTRIWHNGDFIACEYDKSSNRNDDYSDIRGKTKNYSLLLGRHAGGLVLNRIIEPNSFQVLKSLLGRLLISKMTLIDTSYKNEQCYKLAVYKKNSKYVKNYKTTCLINKSTSLPMAVETSYDEEGIHDFSFAEIEYLTTNPTFPADLFYIDTTKFEPYKPKTAEEQLKVTKENVAQLKLKMLDGSSISLAELRGKVVLLDFWFRNCMPCLKLMPDVNRIYNEYKGKDVVVIGVNDADDAKMIADYFELKNYTYSSSATSDQNAAELLGITAFPTTIVIGKDGEILATEVGGSKEYYKIMKKILDQALKAK